MAEVASYTMKNPSSRNDFVIPPCQLSIRGAKASKRDMDVPVQTATFYIRAWGRQIVNPPKPDVGLVFEPVSTSLAI